MKLASFNWLKSILMVIAVLAFLPVLQGCTHARAVGDGGKNLVEPTKLAGVQVSWIPNQAFSYEITKMGNIYVQITDTDKAVSKDKVGKTLSAFSSTLPSKLSADLAKVGVGPGGETLLFVKPTNGGVILGDGITVYLNAMLVNRVSKKPLWTATILSRKGWNEQEDVAVANYTNVLIDELKKSGWIDASATKN